MNRKERNRVKDLIVSVDFSLLMREGETVVEALRRMEDILDGLKSLADHDIDYQIDYWEERD